MTDVVSLRLVLPGHKQLEGEAVASKQAGGGDGKSPPDRSILELCSQATVELQLKVMWCTVVKRIGKDGKG
eukprot:superscaffoldBa00002507_g14503